MHTLVLLPGMDGTGSLFAPFVEAMGEGMPMHIVCYPTTQVLDYAGLEAYAREALPKQGSLIVLGESFSGPIAIQLAAMMPARVKGLVLAGSFARNPVPGLARLSGLTNVMPISGVPLPILAYALLGRHAKSPLRALLAQALTAPTPAVMRARLRAVLAVDVSAALASLNIPVLYLRADQDRVVPRAASAHIVSVYPGAQIIDVPGPHFLLQTAPRETAEVIKDFAVRQCSA